MTSTQKGQIVFYTADKFWKKERKLLMNKGTNIFKDIIGVQKFNLSNFGELTVFLMRVMHPFLTKPKFNSTFDLK